MPLAPVGKLKRAIRDVGSAAVHRIDGRCRFDHAVFMLAHMRCGSTALSHVLCGHPEIAGFGEAHVAYRSERDLGHLMLEIAYNRAWKRGFRLVYDKLLWNRLDERAGPAFFEAKAVFSCRAPEETIASLLNLAVVHPPAAHYTLDYSADYYEARAERLLALWDAFPEANRVGLTHEEMLAGPEAVLARITRHLGLSTPLSNAYDAGAVRWRKIGGDPLAAGHGSIVAHTTGASRFRDAARALPASRRDGLDALYRELSARLSEHRDSHSDPASPTAA